MYCYICFMSSKGLSKHPHIFVSYFRVGRLLYLALLLFIVESWFYGYKLQGAMQEDSIFWIGFWLWSFMFSFIHIFLVLADGWSRFQNYKRAKDQFYMYGFKARIAQGYIGSKCQRMAAETAAEELGLAKDINSFYAKAGVKWFHYVPYFMIAEPFFLLKKSFWQRTFLEKKYISKFDYKNKETATAL